MSAQEPTNRSIGLTVRALRQHARLSQVKLTALMPGWHLTTLSKIESGTRALKAVEVFPLARALGVPPVELLDGSTIRVTLGREVDRLDQEMVALRAERDRLKEMLL